MNYIDLGRSEVAKVTFEADNNLDFRLGTGPFRYTKAADTNDIALITRLSEYDYEMRIIRKTAPEYPLLLSYAISFIGNQGKRYGYISNTDLFNIIKH